MECNVYDPKDYGGYWLRTIADGIDGIILGAAFSLAGAIFKELSVILDILIFLTYMIGFKVYKGATLGYQFMDLELVSINGEKLSVKQIVIRMISSFFSALAFGLGFIWIAFDRNKQAWHDKISGIYVIKDKAKPVHQLNIHQSGLIRTRLFGLQVLVVSLLVFAIFGSFLSRSHQMTDQWIMNNPWIRHEVGNVTKVGRFPTFPNGNVPSKIGKSNGASAYSYSTRRVYGTKGEIKVTLETEKRSGKWVIIQAVYIDGQGEFIDITKPFGE